MSTTVGVAGRSTTAEETVPDFSCMPSAGDTFCHQDLPHEPYTTSFHLSTTAMPSASEVSWTVSVVAVMCDSRNKNTPRIGTETASSSHFHATKVLTRSSRYFLLVQQQHQSILPAFCRLASMVTIATKAVIWLVGGSTNVWQPTRKRSAWCSTNTKQHARKLTV